MRTPKRDYKLPWPRLTRTDISDYFVTEYNAQDARWKRKNRIAQLKRSLARYKYGTNLGFYCHEWHAYKLLQDLSKPGKNATSDDWEQYMKYLQQIQLHIIHALRNAEIRRKEQNND